ncbi:hypothetical protein [Achromobacter sp. 413638]|uniref:hypothetical protein n=1 Tax=Achromobacter sp. 413638 TaxID=3342385 RepID=UPI00370BE177
MNFEYEFDAGVRAYLTGYFRKDPKALAAMSGLGPYSGHWQWPREAGEELDRRRTAILASLPESELLAIECGQIKMEAAIKRLVDELKDPHRIEAAATAERLLAGKGWVPDLMRGAGSSPDTVGPAGEVHDDHPSDDEGDDQGDD